MKFQLLLVVGFAGLYLLLEFEAFMALMAIGVYLVAREIYTEGGYGK